ncbi:adenosylcobalamin-dependent ribonucleoside-diphosphate reductase [Pseudaestuariivita rosea]|uniref:adenosylcobalamin-dependent ribonucleoside-diphosphate reductase n=1 Tax=Pseudaestuariivita rosea TaxID=2763263 RepID=UPI001ABB8467|nr:adenosylcobalamin-dependent ribonucleoside-diphosphate reductase [Pseudaestuariivita rosea]
MNEMPHPIPTLPLQDLSLEIWDRKYRLRDIHGEPLEDHPDETLQRVAQAVARVEQGDLQGKWEKEFLWILRNGAIPAGRILTNLGAGRDESVSDLYPSAINCVVSKSIHDSLFDILTAVRDAGATLKAGCGIGYDFSTIRPEGALVRGNKTGAFGPLAAMTLLDSLCGSIATAGQRRGAQMAVMDIRHPDIMNFIKAKHEKGKFNNFNLSVLVTEDFLTALDRAESWPLVFPLSPSRMRHVDPESIHWCNFPDTGNCVKNDAGKVACEVVKQVPSTELWELLMASTFTYSEPGVIFIDRINRRNNNWFCENIRATNPCAEQPLPPSGACLLGSVDLTRFVRNPFTDGASFDWKRFKRVVAVFSRFLDNVVDLNELPLESQREEILRKRRHGMGVLGLGSAVTMLGMSYGEKDSLQFTDDVLRTLAVTGWLQAIELAREKGPAPIMNEMFKLEPYHLERRPDLRHSGCKVGSMVQGKELFAGNVGYMAHIEDACPGILEKIRTHGARYTHHSSIAPTGTIALSFGNNASSGIEPTFRHVFRRNVLDDNLSSRTSYDVESLEHLAFRSLMCPAGKPSALPENFVTADTVSVNAHIAIQATAQKWVDSSISKTINVPPSITYQDFRQVYLDAARLGANGCTTFRENTAIYDSVLQDATPLKRDDVSSLPNVTHEGCDCGNPNLVVADGCTTCMNCGASKCAI